MNSRERILAALDHRETEQVPVDLSGHRSSGISAQAYRRLRAHLGLEERPIRVYDLIQQLAVIDEDVLQWFGADTIELGRGFSLSDEDWADWILPDGSSCGVPAWLPPERLEGRWVVRAPSGRIVGHMPDGALYFEQVFFPLRDDPDRYDSIAAALEESMWSVVSAPPGPVSDDELRDGARRLRESSDRAILGLFGGNLLEIGQMLFRNDEFLMLLAAEPARAHQFLERLVEYHLSELEHWLGIVGPYIDIIVFGDDLGMQTGPQISPAMYREFFKPRHSAMWNRAKAVADVKVMLHCCGGVRPLIPDLIEAGLDAINPVQVSCAGMEAAQLKADFGSEITFWGGGCDTHAFLPQSTPEEVYRHVRQQVEKLRPGGGFVFQQVHNILADVPPANIAAMAAALKNR